MLLHIIVLGILTFELGVFFVQWMLFKKKEFLYFSIFCLSVCLHNILYNFSYFGFETYLFNNQAFDFFLRRQLALLAFFMYIKFSKYFIEGAAKTPKVMGYFEILEKLMIANMTWQALAALIFQKENLLDLSFSKLLCRGRIIFFLYRNTINER